MQEDVPRFSNSLNGSSTLYNSRGRAIPTGSDDRLSGQKVMINGLSQPIKPYHKTMASLRSGNLVEAFAPKSASVYIADSTIPADRDSSRTHLEVYFPIRYSKETKHEARECQNLCRGQPHKDVQPVCRFCRKNIGPNYKDQVRLTIKAQIFTYYLDVLCSGTFDTTRLSVIWIHPQLARCLKARGIGWRMAFEQLTRQH